MMSEGSDVSAARRLRIVFMGTPEFAVASLDALVASGHEVVGVVSQPDRRQGRGQRLQSPPVAARAKALGLPLLQPESVKTRAFRQWIRDLNPDIAVVAAFGHILGPKALETPPMGCLNVHASLLPRWRGASPIAQAIWHGDAETGISIMQMDPGMDTGPVFATAALPIEAQDTAETLHDKLAALGGALLVETLDAIVGEGLEAQTQPEEGVTIAPMIRKADGKVDWGDEAAAIERQIRAVMPWPGAWTTLQGKRLKVFPPTRAVHFGGESQPGEILSIGAELVVATGKGALALKMVQLEGKRAMSVEALLQGLSLELGERLGE